MINKTVVFTIFASAVVAVTAFAADPVPVAKPMIAKICTNCHRVEAGTLLGYFDEVAFKAKTIQMKIDDSVELIKFDEDEIKVINGKGKTGDGDFLHDNKVEKGHEIKVEFVEKDGVKTAIKIIEKPPIIVSPEMLMTTTDLKKLIAVGPVKGKYLLFDSRPLPRFQEGSIPTAVNFPFPDFDKLADKLLPKDKNALVIFYCDGPTCYLSPVSADKAKKMGYTNLKVYKDGLLGWSEKNYGVLSVQFLKEAWIDKDIPHVLLDVRTRKETAKGFIKGAVSLPTAKASKLIKTLPSKEKKPPIMVYDGKDGVQAIKVAKQLVKAGYNKVLVLTGGYDAWQAAKFEVVTGKLVTKASYTPNPKPGEINLNEFRKYAAKLPANVMLIDVRNADEGKAGMLKTAKLIPVEEIKDRLAEIPKDKLIVTFCSTGVRGEMAYYALKALGYTNVKFVNANIDFKKNGTYKILKD